MLKTTQSVLVSVSEKSGRTSVPIGEDILMVWLRHKTGSWEKMGFDPGSDTDFLCNLGK